MSAINKLKKVVEDPQTDAQCGFDALTAAFKDLAEKVAAIPGSGDPEVEAGKVSLAVVKLGENVIVLGQRFYLAVDVPDAPLPPAGEIDNELPEPPDLIDNELPEGPVTPGNELPEPPTTPDNTLPGPSGEIDNTVPEGEATPK